MSDSKDEAVVPKYNIIHTPVGSSLGGDASVTSTNGTSSIGVTSISSTPAPSSHRPWWVDNVSAEGLCEGIYEEGDYGYDDAPNYGARSSAQETGIQEFRTDVQDTRIDVQDIRTDVQDIRSDIEALREDTEALREGVESIRTSMDELQRALQSILQVLKPSTGASPAHP